MKMKNFSITLTSGAVVGTVLYAGREAIIAINRSCAINPECYSEALGSGIIIAALLGLTSYTIKKILNK